MKKKLSLHYYYDSKMTYFICGGQCLLFVNILLIREDIILSATGWMHYIFFVKRAWACKFVREGNPWNPRTLMFPQNHEHWWFHKTTNIDDATVTCNWYKLFDNIRNPCGALTSYSVLFTTSLKPCLSNTSIVVDLEILMPSENTGRPLEFNIRRSIIKREIK